MNPRTNAVANHIVDEAVGPFSTKEQDVNCRTVLLNHADALEGELAVLNASRDSLRKSIKEAYVHLYAAQAQMTENDDPIICDHVREACKILKEA